ncbi:MAG: hypothetical protein QG621_213 [Patescibacteria group bacterium]|nr:hypothetical protein [Patescibacteria group bacterium]
MSIQEDLKDLEARLVVNILELLKEKGHQVSPEHLSVTIKVKQATFSDQLDESDWAMVLDSQLDWTDEERAFLEYVKNNNNKPTHLPQGKDYRFANGINNFLAMHVSAFLLSKRKRCYSIRKRDLSLLGTEKRKRR